MKDTFGIINIQLNQNTANLLAEIMVEASRTCGKTESMEDLLQLPVETLKLSMGGMVQALIEIYHHDHIAGRES